MFSIGEFARLGGVSARTLRHYDEIGVLRPAAVDPDTGYRGYRPAQLGQLNRIMALQELGLSLTQTRQLLAGVTVEELHGMLLIRRAQLEQEVQQRRNQLSGVEARLRSIAREDNMPPDDIVAKTIPAMGVVVIAGPAAGYAPAEVVPAVNRLDAQFTELGIRYRVKEAGPRVVFFEPGRQEDEITVCLALPVAELPPELPAPAEYRVLPEIEAAVAVRNGPGAAIFPMVYYDLIRWIEERGYRPVPGPGRDVWIHEVDDIADVDQQVFEIQLPFTRPADWAIVWTGGRLCPYWEVRGGRAAACRSLAGRSRCRPCWRRPIRGSRRSGRTGRGRAVSASTRRAAGPPRRPRAGPGRLVRAGAGSG
jgi:DNA-binding transcriptional MerR regulator